LGTALVIGLAASVGAAVVTRLARRETPARPPRVTVSYHKSRRQLSPRRRITARLR